MRLRMTDARERRLNNLCDATNENTKSKAIDCAADFYLKMVGDTTAIPTGRIEQLLELAEEQGSVTPQQIGDILDTNEFQVRVEFDWSVGDV